MQRAADMTSEWSATGQDQGTFPEPGLDGQKSWGQQTYLISQHSASC